MVNETTDNTADVMEPIIFTTIAARKFWNETKPVEIEIFYILLNGTVFRNRRFDLNDDIDRAYADKALIESVLFN